MNIIWEFGAHCQSHLNIHIGFLSTRIN
ncbi:unnamed protein product [Coffea canephora]|uniref:DH200=94 genomic scaffold, scaffold_484 n=1 Tax=Coffea canephora TaxID=49390 RepID=A0A068VFU5_COFCA|nr:unnamed protein product [Coffea canephora]